MATPQHEQGLHLAQFNLAVLRHPLEHPASKGFVNLIDDTNRHAEASPGFVWRHGIDTREDDLPYGDPLITVNASVWETAQQLRDFAYRGFHRDVYRQRADWFVDSAAVMWWVPAGDIPSMDECLARMDFFGRFGSTPYAFTTGERTPVLVLHTTADDGATTCTATLDGETAGRIHADPVAGEPTSWEVSELILEPALHGNHIAAAVVSSLFVAARESGVSNVRAACPADADDAVAQLVQMDFSTIDPWPGAPAGHRCLAHHVEPIRTWRRPPGAKPPRP
ncbi:MAG: DUF3291 domain-containing protein [Ilumatobacteraceae bacterium]